MAMYSKRLQYPLKDIRIYKFIKSQLLGKWVVRIRGNLMVQDRVQQQSLGDKSSGSAAIMIEFVCDNKLKKWGICLVKCWYRHMPSMVVPD